MVIYQPIAALSAFFVAFILNTVIGFSLHNNEDDFRVNHDVGVGLFTIYKIKRPQKVGVEKVVVNA
ncbi:MULTISPECIES: hypothetical protein [Providencia]|uniref:Uncharacterized protein n=1 Tax=Providencia vermicola TaxID=333965 RepID=A0AAX3S101_9GAMM|nr:MULTISPECIES: hypothetical protein [Providencia]USB35470.1 hypothetical protein M5J11_11490 [Providencia vermicola]WFC07976.1 hypothetical protein PG365_06240 [Providencia vermicola]